VKLKPRIGLAVIRHPLEEGGEQAPGMLDSAVEALTAAGMEVVEAPGFLEDDASAVAVGRFFYEQRVPVIALAAATWSADAHLLDLLEECDVPIVTWAWPGMNTGSMCGCQQFCCVLKELGKPYRFIFGPAGQAAVIDRIRTYVAGINLAAMLRKTRFGLVGYRVPGMTEVTFDELELKAALGPRTVHYGLETVEKAMVEIPEADAVEVWERRLGGVKRFSIQRADIVDSMRGYLALKRLADRDGLAGVAIECYPKFMGRLCLAGSLLADEGIVVGCEADMNSTVAMHLLNRLTGQPVHNTDGLGVDLNEGWMVFSHCGNGSLSLAESPEKVEIGHVRLMHRGACALFPAKAGEVTLANLVGRRGTYRIGIAHGQAIPTDMVFAGNPAKVVLDGGVKDYMGAIAREGLGHHWMIGYGDVRPELEEFCGHLKIPCIRCTS